MDSVNKNYNIWVISGAVVLLGVLLFLAGGKFSQQQSYVEVKGLSEKIVKADRAIWTLNFMVSSNDPDSLSKNIEKSIATIKAFLKQKGFEDSEINVAPINTYQDTYKDALYHYNANVQLSVYTNKVDAAKAASQDTLSLIKSGVTLNNNSINFEFSDINSVKPDMLAEAIKNAKESADQFAKESGSSLGGIVQGNQGVFSISDKDPGSPEWKKIRVVSTLRFLLK